VRPGVNNSGNTATAAASSSVVHVDAMFCVDQDSDRAARGKTYFRLQRPTVQGARV
jgi:hypothetical protein